MLCDKSPQNLSNFAYDPVNYTHLHKLGVPELFLDLLTEEDAMLRQFGICGLSNMCLDDKVMLIVKEAGAVPSVVKCLGADNEQTVCAAMVVCYYALRSPLREAFSKRSVRDCILRYKESAQSQRLRNLAAVWIDEYNMVNK